MADTRDKKQRPLTRAVLTGIVSAVTRTILNWLVDQLTG
jgi:hypothetical protein